jgi:hypothetical protein
VTEVLVSGGGLTARVARDAGFKENVAVAVLGLPSNVKGSTLTINANQRQGKITLESAGGAAAGSTHIIVQARRATSRWPRPPSR